MNQFVAHLLITTSAYAMILATRMSNVDKVELRVLPMSNWHAWRWDDRELAPLRHIATNIDDGPRGLSLLHAGPDVSLNEVEQPTAGGPV